MSNLLPRAASYDLDTRNTMLELTSIAAVLAAFWLTGKTDRVVYLGPDHHIPSGSQIALKTEPAGFYFIGQNAIYARFRFAFPSPRGEGQEISLQRLHVGHRLCWPQMQRGRCRRG
jgi:hypothetical protein